MEGIAQSLTGRVVDKTHAPLEVVSAVLLDNVDKKPLALHAQMPMDILYCRVQKGKREY